MQSISSTRCVLADSLLQMTSDSLWLSLSLVLAPSQSPLFHGEKRSRWIISGKSNLMIPPKDERTLEMNRSSGLIATGSDTANYCFVFLYLSPECWMLRYGFLNFGSLSFSLIHLWFVFLLRSPRSFDDSPAIRAENFNRTAHKCHFTCIPNAQLDSNDQTLGETKWGEATRRLIDWKNDQALNFVKKYQISNLGHLHFTLLENI